MSLDLTDVALFVRVCATRNLSAAGREFGLSPAASSARMAQLEKRLGARLLHRTTRQITVTQDGDVFLERALLLLAAAEQAEAAVGHGSVAPQGLLRVAASTTFGRGYIVPYVAEFLREFPGVQLDLRLSDLVVDLAAQGIDVAIRIGPLRDSNLVARVLAPSRLVICASPDYLAAHGVPQHPDELAEHQCLVLEAMNPWRLRERDGSELHVRVGGRLRSDNGEALRDAAVAGLGIGLLSTWLVPEQLRSGALVRILADYPATDSVVSAVYLHRQYLPPKSRAFIDFFAQRFGPEPYWDRDL
ncbi:LysR family transcriptional regulator [Rugamonas rubra]|uniref:Transcriptional regulator, LysR family n=1 Tax=Rugamonas rubra TaxID=758825 RepID=A0A1I4Q939_9BURK|nr:LysR family transcriptional regulator [Rugamonas rubra]SFM36567.1 transcriptional regulator, LysR family [Rugamonas rubra]